MSRNEAKREYRTRAAGFTAVPEAHSGGGLLVRGTPILFKTPTAFAIGGEEYNEIIERGALDAADISDFVFNVEHQGRVYARNRNGSLRMTIMESGADIEADLDRDDTMHRQLYNDIKSGRLDRMSFCFTIAPDGLDFDADTKTFHIRKIKRLYDVSAVAFAAYEGTSISARCADLLGEYHRRQTGENRERQARLRALATYYTLQ
jgi:HK97 family phage prohead protease